MTVEDAYNKLEKLVDDGYGDHKIGYFSHHTGEFIEFANAEPTINGGYYEAPNRPKKTKEVVHLFPLLGDKQ
jgi:hypothetical protein